MNRFKKTSYSPVIRKLLAAVFFLSDHRTFSGRTFFRFPDHRRK